MSNERLPLCAICGCDDEVIELDWGPSPYCACHENNYGHEWTWCQVDGVDCTTITGSHGVGAPYCTKHGGTDYVPHTKEES